MFIAFATFLLIVAGALVTSNDAGLSVPDWPTSFGSIYKIPRMVGGVRFEHSHRMVAELVGLLTVTLAIWLARSEKRRWVKILGWLAVGTVDPNQRSNQYLSMRMLARRKKVLAANSLVRPSASATCSQDCCSSKPVGSRLGRSSGAGEKK